MGFRSRFLPACAALLLFAFLTEHAWAAVKTREVKYTVGGTEYVGFLAHNDDGLGHGRGVLIAPEWVGVNDYARRRATQLAEDHYAAFVFDPYGGGRNAADTKQAAEWSGKLKADRPELRRRIAGALEAFREQPEVNRATIAAIGYCFGGSTVLELARSGADVRGVVSFHGGLATTAPAAAGAVKAKVLVCHGADDPFVPPAEVAAFQEEMRRAKADWQLISYGNSVHSFTNPDADKRATEGVAYNSKADNRSWEAMHVFLEEVFEVRKPVRAAGQLLDVVVPADQPPAAPRTARSDKQTFVFVCHLTKPATRLDLVKEQLNRALDALQPGQAYNVVFATAGDRPKVLDAGRLIAATPQNKRRTATFLATVRPAKGAAALAALKAGLSKKPDKLYFLSDGNLGDQADVDSMIRLAAGQSTRVYTILFVPSREESNERALNAMQRIAEVSRGLFKYVAEDEVK